MNRRGFLRKGFLGLAAAPVVGAAALVSEPKAEREKLYRVTRWSVMKPQDINQLVDRVNELSALI